MATDTLEQTAEGFEIHEGVLTCSIRAYLLREVPGHQDEKLLSQSHCYSRCNSTCPRHPQHNMYG